MKELLLYLMAFLGLLIMFISFIKMLIINMKNNQKKSKSKYIKLAILGVFVFVLSRILHGQLL
ncbi:hypothetical protein ACFTQL_13090 [Peribacillus butanolivorans]|uniref:hypothetical protein n=1 Tax=Peribacillus butanolivorans TaxID=421767 RepID=UPI0036323B2C